MPLHNGDCNGRRTVPAETPLPGCTAGAVAIVAAAQAVSQVGHAANAAILAALVERPDQGPQAVQGARLAAVAASDVCVPAAAEKLGRPRNSTGISWQNIIRHSGKAILGSCLLLLLLPLAVTGGASGPGKR